MSSLAEDISDPSGQKSAFAFLSRCVQVWCQPPADGQSARGLPGFERFVYERLVPTAFIVLSSPQFNIKDGQMMVVCAMTFVVIFISEILFRCYWKSVTSFRQSAKLEGKKHRSSFCLLFFLHKAGHQIPPWSSRANFEILITRLFGSTLLISFVHLDHRLPHSMSGTSSFPSVLSCPIITVIALARIALIPNKYRECLAMFGDSF